MATPLAVFLPGNGKPLVISVPPSGTANTSATPFGRGQIIAVQPDNGKVYAAFYSTSGQALTADASSWPIAQGTVAQFEMGASCNALSFFNSGASAVNVMILTLSRS